MMSGILINGPQIHVIGCFIFIMIVCITDKFREPDSYKPLEEQSVLTRNTFSICTCRCCKHWHSYFTFILNVYNFPILEFWFKLCILYVVSNLQLKTCETYVYKETFQNSYISY